MNRVSLVKSRYALTLAALIVVLSVPMTAWATPLGTYSPSPTDMNDLDHHMLYAWKIYDASLVGKTVTGATITFKQLYNWDTSVNQLFMWLFTTANAPGTIVNGGAVQAGGTCTTASCLTQYQDDPTGTATPFNDFGSATSSTKPGWLIPASAEPGLNMTQRSFSGPGQGPLGTGLAGNPGPTSNPLGWDPAVADGGLWDYTYHFQADELSALNAYISDGTFALGLDPDCHYFNSGITLVLDGGNTIQNGGVPEPGSLVLLGTGLAVLARRFRRK